jgi:hypothetical protein
MTRKWLDVFMLIFLAPAVVFVLSGCGGGGEGGTGGGSMISVGGEPVYDWTKRFGGEFSDYGRAVATDSSGNIYIAGSFTGLVNFEADFYGAETKTSYGNTADIFVTKINASGTHAWTRQIGGPDNNGASGIAVDTSGNVYVAGYFESTVDFKADFGGAEPKTSYGNTDIFVTRINANGTYGWTKRIGGTGNDKASGIAVDAHDNVYVAGSFSGSVNFAADFDGEETKASYGNTVDIFVMKINADGTHAWTKQMGDAGHDEASGIAVDADDNVYVVGYFEGTVDFRADFGGVADPKTSVGLYDAFVTKLSSGGDYFWTKRIGGEEDDWAAGIAVDAYDNVYIAGSFRGGFDFADDFAGDPDQGVSHGDEDIFITMLTADGGYGWSRRMGGAGADAACAVAVDSSGGIYVTGYFEQTVNFAADFSGSNTKTSAGNQDIFITKVSPDGTYGWSRRMGGVDDDYGLGITVNQTDVVYMTGFFTGSVNFGSDFGKSTFKYSSGQTDVFLTKITP